jgi:hypothetical protein
MTAPVWSTLGEHGTPAGISRAKFTASNAPAAISVQRWITLNIDGVDGYVPWFSTGTATGSGQLLSGNGAPSDLLGDNGDFYVDLTGHALIGPKASGTWPLTPALTSPP